MYGDVTVLAYDPTMVRFAGSAEFRGAEFEDVDMSGAVFREVNLAGACMHGVLLARSGSAWSSPIWTRSPG